MSIDSFPKAPPTPLSTYRFPPPLVATEDEYNRISEIIEDDCLDVVNNANAAVCLSDDISVTDRQDVGHDTEQASVHSSARSTIVKSNHTFRSDKVPVTPQSILIMRKASQPLLLKSPMFADRSGKRFRKSKAKHSCKLCDQSFTRAHDLKRHSTIHEKCKLASVLTCNLHNLTYLITVKGYPCPYCSKAFGRKDALTRHLAVRGTNHNDFTKKASAKPKPRPAGLPKPGRMATIAEDSRQPTWENTDPPVAPAQLSEVHLSIADTDPNMNMEQPEDDDDDEGDLDASYHVTEASSRASSEYADEAPASTRPSIALSIPQPFNIDRKSSLVQGLPSAHLHLDDNDVLHPFMDPFTTHCGL